MISIAMRFFTRKEYRGARHFCWRHAPFIHLVQNLGSDMQVISTARTCNLILIVLDCLKPISHKKLIEHELEGFGIRLNKQPPQISFRKKEKGGITFTSAIQNARLDLEGTRPGYSRTPLNRLACLVHEEATLKNLATLSDHAW